MGNTGQKNTFHLSNLPPDIIRMILQMEKPESIDQLRLVSWIFVNIVEK